MTVKTLIKPSEYHDSVSLMLVARELSKLEGVKDAAVVMATEANKSILEGAGLLTDEARAATPNDLVIAVSAQTASVADSALQKAETLLKKKVVPGETGEFKPKTIRGAHSLNPAANVAVISVAGRYAADEAWEALMHGLHVLLFSDNVSLEDEIALKQYARDHGLLLMGPGAGTTILNNVALGFANVIPAGPVGIVSAAGTGLQEVSTLLARHGVGITQGIGTGGRDLKKEVGGIMMLEALKALQQDPATTVLALVSKPPAEAVVQLILKQIAASSKPTVICFLGGDVASLENISNVIPARTLRECAFLAAQAVKPELGNIKAYLENENTRLARQASELRQKLNPKQCYLRGLFSGGTLCYEAQVIWKEALDIPVYSNAPLPGESALPDSTKSQRHTAVDLGEEEFTVGRPHPMIDNDLRIRRLHQEARDPQVAVIMLDVVIGYGAHPDPAAELGKAVEDVQSLAKRDGRELLVVASVTGTEGDPQGLSQTIATLTKKGVIVCDSNAAAARLTSMLISG
ncbi:MAG: acyl-CoA synthetase FdrA [Anaerolineales bacterium]|nr:acyl-CoA synthetase FdrA [Anaerolineales bacterium]